MKASQFHVLMLGGRGANDPMSKASQVSCCAQRLSNRGHPWHTRLSNRGHPWHTHGTPILVTGATHGTPILVTGATHGTLVPLLRLRRVHQHTPCACSPVGRSAPAEPHAHPHVQVHGAVGMCTFCVRTLSCGACCSIGDGALAPPPCAQGAWALRSRLTCSSSSAQLQLPLSAGPATAFSKGWQPQVGGCVHVCVCVWARVCAYVVHA